MLPTEIGSIVRMNDTSKLYHIPKTSTLIKGYQIPHQLYILSNEEIKIGDWVAVFGCGGDDHFPELPSKICQFTGDELGVAKIIATTDKLKFRDHNKEQNGAYVPYSLEESYLPNPSYSFIKKYCELDGIDEVMIEYENIQTTTKDQYAAGKSLNYIDKLKVAPDNTITIKPIKNNWTREELVEFAYRCAERFGNKWVTKEIVDAWLDKTI